jgi:hypothetical protein
LIELAAVAKDSKVSTICLVFISIFIIFFFNLGANLKPTKLELFFNVTKKYPCALPLSPIYTHDGKNLYLNP